MNDRFSNRKRIQRIKLLNNLNKPLAKDMKQTQRNNRAEIETYKPKNLGSIF